MTTITLEVPDSLASQLTPLRDRLPDILQQTVGAWTLPSPPNKLIKSFLVYEEMMDFLASGPTPEKIIAHKASRKLQRRLEALLDKNREEELTEEETAELNAFEQVNDVMSSLKLRARRALRS
jgi:hypothetical protein